MASANQPKPPVTRAKDTSGPVTSIAKTAAKTASSKKAISAGKTAAKAKSKHQSGKADQAKRVPAKGPSSGTSDSESSSAHRSTAEAARIQKLPFDLAEVSVNPSLSALGWLVGLLKPTGPSLFAYNDSFFSKPELQEAAKRQKAAAALIDTLMESVAGTERTAIPAADRWYSLQWKGQPTGLCIVLQGDSKEKEELRKICLGFYTQQEVEDEPTSTLYATLPLFSWKEGKNPQFLLQGADLAKQGVDVSLTVHDVHKEDDAFDLAHLSVRFPFSKITPEFRGLDFYKDSNRSTALKAEKEHFEQLFRMLTYWLDTEVLTTGLSFGDVLSAAAVLKKVEAPDPSDSSASEDAPAEENTNDTSEAEDSAEEGAEDAADGEDDGPQMVYASDENGKRLIEIYLGKAGNAPVDVWKELRTAFGRAIEKMLIDASLVLKTEKDGTASYTLNIALSDLSSGKVGGGKIAFAGQLGAWFEGESNDENWLNTLAGLDAKIDHKPGMAARPKLTPFLPGMQLPVLDLKDGKFSPASKFSLRLHSLGLDITGNDAPLLNIKGYTMEALSLRGYFDTETSHFAVAAMADGIGFPLKMPPQGGGVAGNLLSNGKSPEKTTKPLAGEGKKASKPEDAGEAMEPLFSLKAGFGNPGGHLATYFRVLDEERKETDRLWLPVQSDIGPLHCDRLGIRVSGPFDTDPVLGVGFDGDLTIGGLCITLKQLMLSVHLKNLSSSSGYELDLAGMDVAYKHAAFSLSGGFLKEQTKNGDSSYFGQLSIVTPTFSIAAMGAYCAFKDGTSLFIYGALSFSGGAGITLGPVTITGLALGAGLHRRIVLPAKMSEVATFPLVEAAMGPAEETKSKPEKKKEQKKDASKKKDDTKDEEPEEKLATRPKSMIDRLRETLPVKQGQNFGCIGLRFEIPRQLDCFVLAVMQFGDELEFRVMGLARFSKPVCYAELALQIVVRPLEGYFLVQAELTANSWVLDKKCRLTGGFAMALWLTGAHSGDFVITLGGYHPLFVAPAHYPVVPRIGVNWQVNSELSIEGHLYCAITPSMLMAGGMLKASYTSGDISATFTAYVDFLMQWAPLSYSLEAGIFIRVVVEKWWLSIDTTIGVGLSLWGEPFGGLAVVKVCGLSFEIAFGEKRKLPPAIATWDEFGRNFLDAKYTGPWQLTANAAGAATGPPLCQASVVGGLLTKPGSEEAPPDYWIVRADELAFNVSTKIPCTVVQVGSVQTTAGFPATSPLLKTDGKDRSLMLPKTMNLALSGEAQRKGADVGLAPMCVRTVDTTLCVTVMRDIYTFGRHTSAEPVAGVGQWQFEEDTTGVPAAIWDNTGKTPDMSTPTAKVVGGGLTGLKRLRPPQGSLRGRPLLQVEISKLSSKPVKLTTTASLAANVPAASPLSTLDALREMGFKLSPDLVTPSSQTK